MSMYRRGIVLFGLLVLCLLQVTVFSRSVGTWVSLNTIIIALTLLTIMGDRVGVIFMVIASGSLFDLHSQLPFGIYLLTGIVTALALAWLFEYFFTNRSLYSFVVLTIIATIVYQTLFALITFGLYELGWTGYQLTPAYLFSALGQMGTNLVVTLVVFWIVNRVSVIFKPTYLHS